MLLLLIIMLKKKKRVKCIANDERKGGADFDADDAGDGGDKREGSC